jgi:replicative DNA helicase
VVATAGALFLKHDGRTPLSPLKVGDRVVVPRRVPAPKRTQCMADDEVVLLAHMIGDGSCVELQPPT